MSGSGKISRRGENAMNFQLPWFVQELAGIDPVLYHTVKETAELVMKPGALDSKTKLLIALALDAFKGSGPGVKALAQQVREQGASDEEIQETLRIVYLISTMDCLRAGGQAFSK
jgi:alkylhydroperoxidase/carboxymuconolactone decarboxylase family protein YurZ